jgi:hypothetical protein
LGALSLFSPSLHSPSNLPSAHLPSFPNAFCGLCFVDAFVCIPTGKPEWLASTVLMTRGTSAR